MTQMDSPKKNMKELEQPKGCLPGPGGFWDLQRPLVKILEGQGTEFPPDRKIETPQEWLNRVSKKKHAYTFLETAVKEMKDRAAQRDTQNAAEPEKSGERSMAATIKAFNALTGHNLTEENGWEFMILLKLVRGRQGDFRADDYVDAAAYSALLGECASQTRETK